MRSRDKVVAVIPTLDEEATIASVVGALRERVDLVLVVDGGSRDATVARAIDAGAEVVPEARRGYGRAAATGAARATELGADVIAFLDGGGAEDPADLDLVLSPLRSGTVDFVVGSRVRGERERGALSGTQRAGNALATQLIAKLHGYGYTDLGSMRAIRADALRRLDMREMGCGWPAEMQVKAARQDLRVVEVPMRYRRRRGGRSKISGTIRGSVRAGRAILRVVVTTR